MPSFKFPIKVFAVVKMGSNTKCMEKKELMSAAFFKRDKHKDRNTLDNTN